MMSASGSSKTLPSEVCMYGQGCTSPYWVMENMRLTAITPFLALGEPIPMIGFSGSFNRKGKRALPLS